MAANHARDKNTNTLFSQKSKIATFGDILVIIFESRVPLRMTYDLFLLSFKMVAIKQHQIRVVHLTKKKLDQEFFTV